jgi:hypothetical protein
MTASNSNPSPPVTSVTLSLTRFLHILVTFHAHYPEEPILLTKVDLKLAYQ